MVQLHGCCTPHKTPHRSVLRRVRVDTSDVGLTAFSGGRGREYGADRQLVGCQLHPKFRR